MKIAKNSDQNSKAILCYFLHVSFKFGFSRYSSAVVVHVCIEVQIKVANTRSAVIKLNISCKIYTLCFPLGQLPITLFKIYFLLFS